MRLVLRTRLYRTVLPVCTVWIFLVLAFALQSRLRSVSIRFGIVLLTRRHDGTNKISRRCSSRFDFNESNKKAP